MVNKRGQITIFIVIALVIIGMAVLFFFIQENVMERIGENTIDSRADEVFLFVQDRLEQVSVDGIYAIGLQGGYYIPPDLSIEYGIPYYYYENQNYMPSKLEIGEEISSYINTNLPFCINDFSTFTDLTIRHEELNPSVEIGKGKIITKLDYSLRVIENETSTLFDEFSIDIPVRLGTVYDSIEKIMEDQMTHNDICLSCILDISLENDLFVDISNYDEETVIFVFKDENSKINNDTFEFVFAKCFSRAFGAPNFQSKRFRTSGYKAWKSVRRSAAAYKLDLRHLARNREDFRGRGGKLQHIQVSGEKVSEPSLVAKIEKLVVTLPTNCLPFRFACGNG